MCVFYCPSLSLTSPLHTLDPLKIREESQGVNLLSREGNSQTGHMMRENVEWVGYLEDLEGLTQARDTIN